MRLLTRSAPSRSMFESTTFHLKSGVPVKGQLAIEQAAAAATGSFESSLTAPVGRAEDGSAAYGRVGEPYIAALAAFPLSARFTPGSEPPVVSAGGLRGRGSTMLRAMGGIAAGIA